MLTLNPDLIEQLLQVNRSWDSSALCSSVLHVHNRFGSTRAFFIKQCFRLQLDAAYNCIILWLGYKHVADSSAHLGSMAQVVNIMIHGCSSSLSTCRTHIGRELLIMRVNALDIPSSVKMMDPVLTGFMFSTLKSSRNCEDDECEGTNEHQKFNVFFKKKHLYT